MGHLPFEKWVFYGGFRVGHGSRVRRGVKTGPPGGHGKGHFWCSEMALQSHV